MDPILSPKLKCMFVQQFIYSSAVTFEAGLSNPLLSFLPSKPPLATPNCCSIFICHFILLLATRVLPIPTSFSLSSQRCPRSSQDGRSSPPSRDSRHLCVSMVTVNSTRLVSENRETWKVINPDPFCFHFQSDT